jgi:hypothetical protein
MAHFSSRRSSFAAATRGALTTTKQEHSLWLLIAYHNPHSSQRMHVNRAKGGSRARFTSKYAHRLIGTAMPLRHPLKAEDVEGLFLGQSSAVRAEPLSSHSVGSKWRLTGSS